MLLSLRTLLSTPSGRDLIYGLSEKSPLPVVIVEVEPGMGQSFGVNYKPVANANASDVTASLCSNFCVENAAEGIVRMSNKKRPAHRIVGEDDGDKVVISMVLMPDVLFHELTHAYHELIVSNLDQFNNVEAGPIWGNQEERRTIEKTNAFLRELKLGTAEWAGRWGHASSGRFYFAYSDISLLMRLFQPLRGYSAQLHELFDYNIRISDFINASASKNIYAHQSNEMLPICLDLNLDLERAVSKLSTKWVSAILNSKRHNELSPKVLRSVFLEMWEIKDPKVREQMLSVIENSKSWSQVPSETWVLMFHSSVKNKSLSTFIGSKYYKKLLSSLEPNRENKLSIDALNLLALNIVDLRDAQLQKDLFTRLVNSKHALEIPSMTVGHLWGTFLLQNNVAMISLFYELKVVCSDY